MQCPACHAENAEVQKFCGQCGTPLAPVPTANAPVAVSGEDGAFYCAKHTKIVTRLRCGRCEMPICPKCTVFTPAGTRCKVCARNRVAIRPAGVLHDAGRVIANTSVSRPVWYLALWYLIMSFFRNGGEW